MLLRILIGFAFIAAGIGLSMKADWVYQTFGGSAFAEKWLRSEGGSRLFYRLIGILLIMTGAFVVANLHETVILGVLRRLFGI